jgi:hypothetical protein
MKKLITAVLVFASPALAEDNYELTKKACINLYVGDALQCKSDCETMHKEGTNARNVCIKSCRMMFKNDVDRCIRETL